MVVVTVVPGMDQKLAMTTRNPGQMMSLIFWMVRRVELPARRSAGEGVLVELRPDVFVPHRRQNGVAYGPICRST